MTTDRVDGTSVAWGSVEWTMLCTLYLRAYESRSPDSILADHAAAEAIDRIDYDWTRVRRVVRATSNQYLVGLRAAQLDEWAADFLRRHPDAVVVHLGAGCDSRAFRLTVPPGVRWFDLDVPSVIDLRRRLYPQREGYRTIATSVTDPAWLAEIPADRPTLIVAEGLLPYLAETEVRTLLTRLTDHFGHGELLFDTVAPWVVRLAKIEHWGLRDPARIHRWNPRLRLLATMPTTARSDRIPVRRYRILFGVLAAVAPNSSRLLRLEF
jgi:methyltransferase (TIGR00027 family)